VPITDDVPPLPPFAVLDPGAAPAAPTVTVYTAAEVNVVFVLITPPAPPPPPSHPPAPPPAIMATSAAIPLLEAAIVIEPVPFVMVIPDPAVKVVFVRVFPVVFPISN
jgi:hypothetical protein